MGVMKYVLVAASLIATDVVFAETTTLAFNSSPLMPGSQVVAGDLTKNEFFITGKDEPPAIRPVIKTIAQEKHPEQPAEFGPKIKMAENKPVEKKHFVPEVKVALNKTFTPNVVEKPISKPAIHPLPIQTQTALNQEPRYNNHSEKLHLPTNSIVKDSQHKVVEAKAKAHETHFYSFKQPVLKQHNQMASTNMHVTSTHVVNAHVANKKAAIAKPNKLITTESVATTKIATKHVAAKSVATTKVATKYVAAKHIAGTRLSNKHVSSKHVASKHIATSTKVAVQKPVAHHSPHKNFVQTKKHQYQFVSLTKQRHTLKIKTAFVGKHHSTKR